MKRRLPPYVQRVGAKYRGVVWIPEKRKSRFLKLRSTPQQAHADAVAARGMAEPPSAAGTLEDRAKEWIAAVRATRTNDTAEFYESKLEAIYKTIPRSMAIARVRPEILRALVLDMLALKRSARTIQHCRRTLNRLFVWCMRRGYLQQNPVGAVDWPKTTETRPDTFTEPELFDVLGRVTDPFAHDLAVFLAYTGLRRAEAARLEIRDLDPDGGAMWVRGKAGAQSHPIDPEAAAAVKRLIATAEGTTLIRGSTERARRERIAETFRVWQRKIKEPRLHPHALRHSVATIMIRKGVSPATVQRFLRHASYAMTQRYVSLVADDVRRATARLRLVGGDEQKAHG